MASFALSLLTSIWGKLAPNSGAKPAKGAKVKSEGIEPGSLPPLTERLSRVAAIQTNVQQSRSFQTRD